VADDQGRDEEGAGDAVEDSAGGVAALVMHSLPCQARLKAQLVAAHLLDLRCLLKRHVRGRRAMVVLSAISVVSCGRCSNTQQTHGERAALPCAIARRLYGAAVKLDKTADDSQSDPQAAANAV